MNASVRQFITSIPVLKQTYIKARSAYNAHRFLHEARAVFSDVEDFRRAVTMERPGQHIDLCTCDGLHFLVRQNRKDAEVLAEMFLDLDYVRGFQLPKDPIIVDIGGYIGDFAIYAAKYLKPQTVITIEPSPQNFALLDANIRLNQFEDRIVALPMAVTDGHSTEMNIDTEESGQLRVSAFYGTSHGVLKKVPGISLAQIMNIHQLPRIDLLKIDCEGGEYTILLTAPDEVLHATSNLVFEFHEIENSSALLAKVKARLQDAGFTLEIRGRGNNLIAATRHVPSTP
jgi:FkbM family methyltransferase